MKNLENINVAEFPLKIMFFFGIVRPPYLTSSWAIRLHNLYGFIVLLYKFYFSITFLFHLCQNKDKADVFIKSLFIFTTSFLIASKVTYLKFHQHDIKNFMNLILQKNYLPRNNEEALIYSKGHYKERLVMQCAQNTKSTYVYKFYLKVNFCHLNYIIGKICEKGTLLLNIAN